MNIHTKEVFLKASKTTIVQFVGVGSRLLTSIFLGRILGASGLGDVNLINQIITILMVLSMFGMDHVLVKKIAIGQSEKNQDAIGKVIYTGLVTTTIIAALLTFLVIIGSEFIALFFDAVQLKLPLIIAAVVIIPQTISVVFAASINGFEKVWQSRLFKDFLTSIFVLIGLSVAYFFSLTIDLINVMIIYAVSRLLTFVFASFYLRTLYPPLFISSKLDASMIAMAKPLLFVSATTLLASSVDVIMLGWLSSSENVGLYTVASRLVLFIAFFLQITNSAISPKIASFYANGQIEVIRKMVHQVTFGLVIIGLLSTVLFVIFGNEFLGLWGSEFTSAYTCLLILCIGQFVNISTGCSGVLLIMSGNEKVFSYLSGASLVVNLILNYVLIQSHGIIGAAMATSATIATENIVRVIVAKRKTGVLTIPILRSSK